MTVNLQFDAEVERKLQEAAARDGLTVEAYLQRLAEQSVASRPVSRRMSREEWSAAFRAWLASHKPLPHIADDDRESFYAGRDG